MKSDRRFIALTLFLLHFFIPSPFATARDLPKGFVYVEDIVPDIVVELRYCTKDNFVGEPIEGYLRPRCIATKETAKALSKVQNELKRFSLGLKIFDAYRPQRAVKHFVRWAGDLRDIKMKPKYYPDVDKKDLFKKAYIASNSSHSRGSAVDY